MSVSGYLFRGPRNTPESRAGRPPEPRTETRPGMVIDRDVAVLTGSGATIRVDVCRPAGGEAAAPIVGWMPYGKHNPASMGMIGDLEAETAVRAAADYLLSSRVQLMARVAVEIIDH
jgi:hypothetical protein